MSSRFAVPKTVLTTAQLEEVAEFYAGVDEFVFDVETVGKRRGHPKLNRVTWLGLAHEHRTDVIPMGHPKGEMLRETFSQKEPWWDENDLTKRGKPRKKWRTVRYPSVFTDPPEQLWATDVWSALEPAFFGEATKIGHGVKFDLLTIAKYYDDTPPAPPYGDSLILARLLNNLKKYGLKDITNALWGHDYDQENIAKPDKNGENGIEVHAFSKAARYTHLDVRYTWLIYQEFRQLLHERGVRNLDDLEHDVLEALLPGAMTGIRLDVDAMQALGRQLTEEHQEIEKRIFHTSGKVWDLNSAPAKRQFVYEERGHEPFAFTKGGKDGKNPLPQTTAAVLEVYAKKDPAIADLVDYAVVQKLRSTYSGWQNEDGTYEGGLLNHVVDGRIYTDLVQYGTDTGRFSCVSGDTLLETSRGTFRFDEYLPEEGDLVPTHAGNWQPVVRKVFKGTQQMYSIVLSNGARVTCTADHRVLTPSGWSRVGELVLGDEVCGYERVEEVRSESDECEDGARSVSARHLEADDLRDSTTRGDDLPQRAGHLEGERGARGSEAGAGAAVLTLEDRREEPYAGQEWFPTPQLHRGRGGWEGLPPEEGGREVRLRSPARDGRGARAQEAPSRGCCASHQRGQEGQSSRQPRGGDRRRASEAARLHPTLTEVHAVGAMGVWDIEVAGDHSYATQGLFHHNSRNPNLQNIPSRSEDPRAKALRKMFVADPEHSFIVADYSQIEYRVLASMAREPVLLEAFAAGWDPHAAVMAMVLGKPIDEVTKEERDLGKSINFAAIYGAGPGKIANMANVSMKRAKWIKSTYEDRTPKVTRFKKTIINTARNRKPQPYVETLLRRRRWLPALWSTDDHSRFEAERQAVNTVVQGTAADVIKVAMVKLHHVLPEHSVVLLQVHDELVVQAPDEHVEEVRDLVQNTMEAITLLDGVDLHADANIGKSWAEAK